MPSFNLNSPYRIDTLAVYATVDSRRLVNRESKKRKDLKKIIDTNSIKRGIQTSVSLVKMRMIVFSNVLNVF